MKKFVRPSVFFRGNKEKSIALAGVARSFLDKTLLWNKHKYFKRSLLLDDGSTITIQKLMNGQFLTFIDTFIPEVGGEAVSMILFERTTLNIFGGGTSLDEGDGQGLIAFDDTVLEKSITLNTTRPPEVEAGNHDWRSGDTVISWMGSYNRYRNNPPYYFDVDVIAAIPENHVVSAIYYCGFVRKDSLQFSTTISYPTNPDLNSTTEIRYALRYGPSIYQDGLEIASTADITDITTTGNIHVVGAGLNKGNLLVVVKDMALMDEFYLYRVTTSTDTWTRIGTLDFSESGWHCPGVHRDFRFNEDGTKIVTITKKFDPTRFYNNNAGLSGGIGNYIPGSTQLINLEEKDETWELLLGTDGNGLVDSIGTKSVLQTINIIISPAIRLVYRDPVKDDWYEAVDYKAGVKVYLEPFNDLSAANGITKLTYAGNLIEGTELGLPLFADLRYESIILDEFTSQPSFEYLYDITLYQKDLKTTKLAETIDSTVEDIISGGDGTRGSSAQYGSSVIVEQFSPPMIAIDRDGEIFYTQTFRLNPRAAGSDYYKLNTYYRGIDLNNDIFSDSSVLEENWKLLSYYDYNRSSYNSNSQMVDPDVAVCPL